MFQTPLTDVSISKGFGFATFDDHNIALRVVKHFNNHPTIFSDVRRPIVDFAIEDKRALKHQQMLLEKLTRGRQSNNTIKKKIKKHRTYSRGKYGNLEIVF